MHNLHHVQGQMVAEVQKARGWLKEYSRNSSVRRCTGEQMILYILPPLAGLKGPDVTVKVEPDEKTESQT